MTGPASDLLVAGDDRPERQWSSSRRARVSLVAVLALLIAGASGVLVQRERAADQDRPAARAAEAVQLALRPGRVPTPRFGHLRRSLHVVVANEGASPVQLLRGSLVPGRWRVEVLPDTVLRPGRLTVLRLSPPGSCAPPLPRRLRLDARTGSGRTGRQVLDLAGARLADGGRLDEAMVLAATSCASPSDGRTSARRS